MISYDNDSNDNYLVVSSPVSQTNQLWLESQMEATMNKHTMRCTSQTHTQWQCYDNFLRRTWHDMTWHFCGGQDSSKTAWSMWTEHLNFKKYFKDLISVKEMVSVKI